MLKEIFTTLISGYSKDSSYSKLLWEEIAENHTKKNRYYHNLTHLQNLYENLLPIKTKIQDWNMVLFALFYHDIVYNILKNDNEDRSAKKAVCILKSLEIDTKKIDLCQRIILSTAGHQLSAHNDINYFTDADVCILGSCWTDYKNYFNNIRKEYSHYPDFIYNKGRIKVLS